MLARVVTTKRSFIWTKIMFMLPEQRLPSCTTGNCSIRLHLGFTIEYRLHGVEGRCAGLAADPAFRQRPNRKK